MLYSFLNTFYKSPELKSQFILYMNILSIIYTYLKYILLNIISIYISIVCAIVKQKETMDLRGGGSMREVGGRKRIGGMSLYFN